VNSALDPILHEVTRPERPLNLYAVADSAQDKRLPAAIDLTRTARCLFGYDSDTEIAKASPHLVLLSVEAEGPALKWIAKHAPVTPCLTLIGTALEPAALYEHLTKFLDVRLPGNSDMFLAWWDPTILATLVGQPDDVTLHVPGPALQGAQRSALMEGIAAWWYWDRDGGLHRIDHVPLAQQMPPDVPFELTQAQVDLLVEASVPDHVLHYIELNQAHLLQNIPGRERYRSVRSHLQHARDLGLVGMADLVNFTCAGLIYGDALRHDSVIAGLLKQVSAGALTLDQAMDQFP
jgi:Domain of unknown function (DUF4123)